MYTGEQETLPDTPTKYCWIAASLTFTYGYTAEITGLFEKERAHALPQLISFGHFQLKARQREKIDGRQSNYINQYMPSCLIPLVWERESCEGEDDTDESLQAAWDLLCSRQGFRSARLPVCEVSYNHRDALIQLGLSHRTLVVQPDMKCKWGMEDVNGEVSSSQLDIVINVFVFVLRATSCKIRLALKELAHSVCAHVTQTFTCQIYRQN